MVYVIMYLVAIVLANLSVAAFGPSVTIINAFLFIGLDLTARDKLHDVWHNSHLWRNMTMLIAFGSLLSWFLNRGTGRIALASFVAFLLAAVVDTVVYQWLTKKSKWIRINGSNIPSALVDSIVFPSLAFGRFLPLITLGQFVAKVFGGFVWSVLLNMIDRKTAIRELSK